MNMAISTPSRTPEDPVAAAEDVPCTADVAECTCPDFCERDHEND